MFWCGTGYWSESFKSPVLPNLLRPIISNFKQTNKNFVLKWRSSRLGIKIKSSKLWILNEWNEDLAKPDCQRRRQKQKDKLITTLAPTSCDWLNLQLLLGPLTTSSFHKIANGGAVTGSGDGSWRLTPLITTLALRCRLPYGFVTHSLDDCVTSQKNKEF